MTEQEAKNKLIAVALGEVGYREGGNNWHKYASEMITAYGWNTQNQPWCDVFADWCFVKAFGMDAASKMTYQPIGGFSALCRASADFYKTNGAWSKTPEPGDQIFMIYDGGINHTGIVEKVSGGLVYTIEGNSSDMVRRGTYAIGTSIIAGYGRPKWSVVASENAEADAPAPTKPADPLGYKYHAYTYNVAVSLLKKGDFGPQVLHMQQLLNANGFEIEADGQFGDKTFEALKNFQKAAKIEVDGEWGGQSFKAMWNYK
jgi:hypothetical protein